MKSEIKLPFGLKDGRLYHITEVNNGLKCKCICPNCGVKLIAKNNPSNKVTLHFAHHKSSECPGSLETAIHLMAKQVIKDKLLIYTPKYSKPTRIFDENGQYHTGKSTHIRPKKLELDRVELEVTKKGYRPDVIAIKNDRVLNIEIKVTHDVDEEKASLVKSLQEPMLEIDLSDLIEETLLNKEQFEWEVTHNVNNKKWINNPKGELAYKRHLAELKAKVAETNEKARLKKRKQQEREEYLKNLKVDGKASRI